MNLMSVYISDCDYPCYVSFVYTIHMDGRTERLFDGKVSGLVLYDSWIISNPLACQHTDALEDCKVRIVAAGIKVVLELLAFAKRTIEKSEDKILRRSFMENKFQPYSASANLEAIRAISREIILSVVPEEEAGAEELMDGLIEDYEDGLITTANTDAKISGGFGNVDLVALVVIPLVVAVLKKFFEELIELGFEKYKEWLKEHKEKKQQLSVRIDQLVEEQYTIISTQVKSTKSKSKEKVIKQTTKIVVKRKLGLSE